MATSLTAKEIADQLSLPVNTVNFRIHQLRKEAKEEGTPVNDFVPPFNDATMEAVKNFCIRTMPVTERRGTNSNRIEAKNKEFYLKFGITKPSQQYLTCKDGTQILGVKALARWEQLLRPSLDSPNLEDVLLSSADTKTYNKAKREAGFKTKGRAKVAYSYLTNDCFMGRTNARFGVEDGDTPEVLEWKKRNRQEVKQMMNEDDIDLQRAQAEWLLLNKWITHDTYWEMRDKQEEAIARQYFSSLECSNSMH